MYSIVGLIFLLKVTPVAIGWLFVQEVAYNISYMADSLAALLAAWYVYLTIPQKKYVIKGVAMITLVASALFFVNYVLTDSSTNQAIFEFIGG